jgi:hypothetical protein
VDAEGNKRKRKKRSKKDFQLDEEDLELIGVRPAPSADEDQNKHKRLKRLKKSTEDNDTPEDLKTKLSESLFGADGEFECS